MRRAEILQPDQRQYCRDPFLSLGPPDAANLKGKSDVSGRRPPAEQAIAREEITQVWCPCPRGARVDENLAFARLKQPADQVQERGLAASAWAYDGHELSWLDRQRRFHQRLNSPPLLLLIVMLDVFQAYAGPLHESSSKPAIDAGVYGLADFHTMAS
jgi:hypothetical protein